jgi:uncharacterized protein
MQGTNDKTFCAVPSEGGELQPDPPPQAVSAQPARRRRGFATMNPDLVRQIARKGGKAAHASGTAHEFTSDEARVAGRRGGYASQAKRRKLLEAAEGK